MPVYDYLIVGQGIAGTMLSHFLTKKGSKSLVVDQYHPSSASNVAAGIVNPLTGRRLVKTWMADSIFPFADSAYRELEKILHKRLWNKTNIGKILSTPEEYDFYNQRKVSPEYLTIISPPDSSKLYALKQPVAFEIRGGGYLEMAKLVKGYREKLLQNGMLVEETFRNADMVIKNGIVNWKEHSFRKVIFCEGYRATENSFFSWIPFVLAKGEVLVIHSKELDSDKIAMRDIFVLPLGNGFYKVGATYQWDQLNSSPTEKGRSELTQKLDSMLGCSYTVEEHLAGIRPVIKDRKPCLGMHPIYKCFGIFNGLGTKGASLAPYFASHFADFLEEDKPLHKEVDIARFYKYFRG